MPELFDVLLPISFAVIAFFFFAGMYALSNRKTKHMGSLLIMFSGIGMLMAAKQYLDATADIGMSILIVGAGMVVILFSMMKWGGR